MNKKWLLLGSIGIGMLLLSKKKDKANAVRWHINILGASSSFNVPPGLIAAVIQKESSGNPDAFGYSNEYGLMQLLCSTARDMGFSYDCKKLFDPAVNIYYGTKYLSFQYDRYGSWEKAISAYNAGHYTETNREYVDSVISLWKKQKI